MNSYNNLRSISDKDKLKQLFEQAGFNKIKIRSFTGGVSLNASRL